MQVVRSLRYVEKCQARAWHLNLTFFDPRTGEVRGEQRVNFKCRSWRHKGECQRWRAAQNFARISDAFAPLKRQNVVFLVLTLDPREWRDRFEAFADLSERWSALRKAITRRWGSNDWVGTVEVHRSGWPHMNIVMHCPILANAQVTGAQAWLRRHAQACGFGANLTFQRAKNKQKLAGYVVKVAGEVEQAGTVVDGKTVGEVVKFSQVPEEAPKHFRRLRSSVRFLPKPHKSDSVTGELVKEPMPVEPPKETPETTAAAPAVAVVPAPAAPRPLEQTTFDLWRETG